MAIAAVEKVLTEEPESHVEMEELWKRELRCAARAHDTDGINHSPNEPATVRGTGPCGKTMNVCRKFAQTFSDTGWRSVNCQCGGRHFASSFVFTNI